MGFTISVIIKVKIYNNFRANYEEAQIGTILSYTEDIENILYDLELISELQQKCLP